MTRVRKDVSVWVWVCCGCRCVCSHIGKDWNEVFQKININKLWVLLLFIFSFLFFSFYTYLYFSFFYNSLVPENAKRSSQSRHIYL